MVFPKGIFLTLGAHISILTLSILSLKCLSIHKAAANGLFEISTGLTAPTGSDFDRGIGGAVQTTLGWGGRPSFMGDGGAIYILGSLRRENLSQKGPIYFGSPMLKRRQWTPSVGVRAYHLLWERFRLNFDFGLGYVFDQSAISTATTQAIINDLRFSGESSALMVGIGLQYKIQAGLLLLLSYEHLFYLDSEALSFSEKPFLTAQDSTLSGRARINLGIGFYL